MSEDKGSGLLGGLLQALHPEARGVISFLLAVVSIFCAIYVVFFIPSYFKKLTGGEQQYCWDVREIQGAPAKFNKCTGEISLIDLKPKQPTETPKQ